MEEKISQAQPIAEFAVQLSKEDYKKYRRFLTPKIRREELLLLVLLSVLLALGAFLILATSFPRPLSIVMILTAYIALWVGFPKFLCYIGHRVSKPELALNKTYQFFENHLCARYHDRGSEQIITTQYTDIAAVTETSTAFYLKTPDKDYVILPKRCIAQTETLRALFARTFGARFKGK